MTADEPLEEVPGAEPAASDSRGWAVAAHLIPLLGASFIAPLIVWLIKREEDPFVEEHSREALNFQISVLIYGIGLALLVWLIIPILLLLALAIFAFVAPIVAAVKAANGEGFRYPLTIRLINP